MSQQRPPAPRTGGSDGGGRHGRQAARPGPQADGPRPARPRPPYPDTGLRPQLLRTTVLPTLAAALSGATAVAFTIQTTGAGPSTTLWAVLATSAVLAMASVAAAAISADRLATTVLSRAAALRRTAERDQTDLAAVVEGIRRGEGPPPARPPAPAPTGGDEFDLLARELGRFRETAVAAVVQASRLSTSVGNEQKVEVFVNLARRLQSLVHREIQLLDDLENEVEDPELLKGLFHVDHLATRIRRHAENLAVLGGAVSRRQWSNPVTMTEVLRSAIAEVEQYPRVKLVPPIDGTLRGHAVADVIHLLAELVENATLFSAPHTQVLLRAQYVTAGLAVEVEDRGLGMPADEQTRMNALLADPDQVNVAHLLQDGRIGLFVVSALARRHGIAVRLRTNIYGGVQAVLVLPQGLLGTDPEGLRTGGSLVPSPSGRTRRARNRFDAPLPVPAAVPVPAGDGGTRLRPAPHPVPRPPGPLPVRTENPDRRNPATAALTGAPPHPFRTPADHDFPRYEPVYEPRHAAPAGPGEPERPRLPRRRVQEHLVPQLRTPPPPRRPDENAVHDPGLMAAFQRGITLAEAADAQHRQERQHSPRPHHETPTASHAPMTAPGDPRRNDTTTKE
ncbi:sensor histidine kinase [Streptomyces qinzhouensis]|uniref:histidine kinase n=1 Tax=Streptomyces qinzhouensis TaxID=2599401 RepID=A0A5B8JQL0_9ACTN|nr:ATP-binding protein [Streptomyces qinzhouensis]QDY79983.1 sensor histidine kinase [Streptomyces qinzhouensis]